MSASTGVSANNATVVTLTPEQLAAEEEGRLAALARNRELAAESLDKLRAKRAELVAALDAKIAETERMLAETGD